MVLNHAIRVRFPLAVPKIRRKPVFCFNIDFLGVWLYYKCMENEFSYQFYNTTKSAWEAMYRGISVAQKSVYWEVYALLDDISGKPFIDLLCEKAKYGIDVKIIIDGVGSYHLTDEATKRLRLAGAKVFIFNRLYPGLNLVNWSKRLWYRTHRKVLIIDEETVFIGGVNVEDLATDWDDLHLKLTGRIVRPMLYGFAQSYVHSGGNEEEVRQFLHSDLSSGINDFKEKVNFIVNTPYIKESPIKEIYTRALNTAKESFNLLTPYYVPDFKFLEMVSKARRRGVAVNVILPLKTDVRVMQYMARAFYGISVKDGAVFYFLRNMNHGKAVTSDNKMGFVGSANLTHRGFFINQEAGVVFSHEQMINDLNRILDDWKKTAVPLSEVGWEKRNWYVRFKDWWVRRFKDYV